MQGEGGREGGGDWYMHCYACWGTIIERRLVCVVGLGEGLISVHMCMYMYIYM